MSWKAPLNFRNKNISSTFRLFGSENLTVSTFFLGGRFPKIVETCWLRQWWKTWTGCFEKASRIIKKIQTKFEILATSWFHVSGPTKHTQKETGKEHGRSRQDINKDSDLKKCNHGSEKIYVCIYRKNNFFVDVNGVSPSKQFAMAESTFEAFPMKDILERWQLSIGTLTEKLKLVVLEEAKFGYRRWSYVQRAFANFRPMSCYWKNQITRKLKRNTFFNVYKRLVRGWLMKISS